VRVIGRTLSHYRILSPLGKGGMGEVYLAEDTRLKRRVALKILPAGVSDPTRLARFRREAETVAALSHPNIVTIHSVEEDQGVHFITMELVEGSPLDRLIREGALPLTRIFELAVPLAGALSAAHDKGITHRRPTCMRDEPRECSSRS
jgi:serine/threonine protein kinase